MSLNVLIIPEDAARDQYLLRPILRRLVASAGAPAARVAVCTDPRLRGVAEALAWPRIEEILESYPMVDLFLCREDVGALEARVARWLKGP